MKKTYRYFAYSHETGFDTYETADEAKKAVEESLQAYRDVADDDWDDKVTGVRWGEIKQETVELPTGKLITTTATMLPITSCAMLALNLVHNS